MNFDIEWAELLLPPFVYVAAAALVLFLIWLCRWRLRELLTVLGIKSFSIAGMEVSLSTAEVESAQKRRGLDDDEPRELDRLAVLAAPYVKGRRILWVDDEPRGNDRERRAFRLLGIAVDNRLNTAEALKTLCRDHYDLVITDYTRCEPGPENPCRPILQLEARSQKGEKEEDSGLLTLSEAQRISRGIPVIFYHGNSEKQSDRDKEVKAEGAYGATYSPATLYRWVLFILMQLAFTKDGLGSPGDDERRGY